MAPLGAAAMSGVVTTLGAAGQPTATASVWKLDRFHPTRRAAHVLYAWLKRQVPRLQRVRAEVEDGLLALLRESAPARPGYRTFTEFAAAEFGLAERTARDGLRRAQRRLGVDLLSQALADGRVCEVPGAELERLLRRAGIPRSRGGPWIERASGVTVRELRDMIEWAIGESHQNYCAWSVNGYLPLTEEQLRATRTSLQTMAENPQPPDLKTQQLLRQMPMVTTAAPCACGAGRSPRPAPWCGRWASTRRAAPPASTGATPSS